MIYTSTRQGHALGRGLYVLQVTSKRRHRSANNVKNPEENRMDKREVVMESLNESGSPKSYKHYRGAVASLSNNP